MIGAGCFDDVDAFTDDGDDDNNEGAGDGANEEDNPAVSMMTSGEPAVDLILLLLLPFEGSF